METQSTAEYPLGAMEKPPRKRPRLTWDIPPSLPPKEYVNGYRANYAFQSYYYSQLPRYLSPPMRADDKDGHYVFSVGENLTPRYRILSKMGEGTFGQVLECWDMDRLEPVAIKIVRSTKKYREAAMLEIDVLQRLAKHDIGGSRCVQIRNWFDYRSHICIVFEKLGPSLYDFLRKNSYRSFQIDLVRELGRQLLDSVAFMHDMRLIHTDLKPENILLVSSEYIRVPDTKGEALFQTHENLEHLAMMERVLGPLPVHMIRKADRHAEKYFKRGLRLDWPEGSTSRESMRAVGKLPRLQNLIMQHVDHSAGDLIDLLQGLLCYDPAQRLKAEEALHHPFFTRDFRRCLCLFSLISSSQKAGKPRCIRQVIFSQTFEVEMSNSQSLFGLQTKKV